MFSAFNENERNVIPRWRSFNDTAFLGELDSINKPQRTFNKDYSVLRKKQFDWEVNRSILFAVDFVSTAFVYGDFAPAQEAARFILSSKGEVSEYAKSIARKVILDDGIDVPCPVDNYKYSFKNAREKIKYLRSLLLFNPGNVIALVDMAREYSVLGNTLKARKYIEMAMSLQPNNRFVLRAACRLFIHHRDPGRAQYLMKNSEILNYDPWILSAEIVSSTLTGHTSMYIRKGRDMVESQNISPLQITELSSALGTVEYNAGSIKPSRKFFLRSLECPNDNSLAQAVWVSKNISSLTVDIASAQQNIPCIYEARARKLLEFDDWKGALEETEKWLADQPFSRDPAILGSFLASVALDDYNKAIDIAMYGLMCNPDETILLNNTAFSYASLNKLDKAQQYFDRIKLVDDDHSQKIVWLATNGLLSFRKGNIAEGRDFYQKAIELANSKNEEYYCEAATLYLAREELLSNTPECFNIAEDIVKKVEESKFKFNLILQDKVIEILNQKKKNVI